MDIEYPYSVEEDIGYNPAGAPSYGPVPVPAPAPAPYYHPGGYAPAPGGYAPAPGGYAPGGYAPAPGGYAPAPGGYAPAPGGYAPQPPSYSGLGSGYALPPAPEDLNLPKYAASSKEDIPKAKPAKKPADDDSDDEDLMNRLKNLQK